jgi:sterol-4alpha-carboxylate 3-dehydrogenase (decarboxylating)
MNNQAQAEVAVLAANRSPASPKLLTCAIRPAGIFGEGDTQALPSMAEIALTSKTNFQLGTNENLFDFTYVGNIAHAHLLAAHALLATSFLTTAPLDHEKVDGEAFIITNDEPVYFWDFARAVWKAAGKEGGTENVRVIGKEVGLALAGVMEWGMWAVGKKPTLTRRVVKYSCMVRYYDCGKAKRRLGYKPITPLGEGIEKGVKWWLEEQKAKAEKKAQ